MSDTVKINLKNVLIALTIVIMVSGLIGSCYIAYDNIKTAKTEISKMTVSMLTHRAASDARLTQLEVKQARFEGKLDERTSNTQSMVKLIQADMKLLLNKLELSDGKD